MLDVREGEMAGVGKGNGWGARIRTWDAGTKNRCLTTWPHPIIDQH